MNLECGKCNIAMPTKLTYDLHTHLCSQKKNSAKEIAMFQCILALTRKCESLERKLAKIDSCTTRVRKKNIEEYLQFIPPPKMDYETWLSSIEVSETDLNKVLEYDLDECIKSVLIPLLNEIPIRAFKQKASVFYLYDKCGWRIMMVEELSSLVKSIAHKAKRPYAKWYKDNADEINSNDTKRDEAMFLMKKLIAKDNNVSVIKKWLFERIAVSLNDV